MNAVVFFAQVVPAMLDRLFISMSPSAATLGREVDLLDKVHAAKGKAKSSQDVSPGRLYFLCVKRETLFAVSSGGD